MGHGHRLVAGRADVHGGTPWATYRPRSRWTSSAVPEPPPTPRSASACTTARLGLWRGPLPADVADDGLRRRLGGPLGELGLSALEQRGRSAAGARHARQGGADLMPLAREHPDRERPVAAQMTALCRSGRQADALGALPRHTQGAGDRPGHRARRRAAHPARADAARRSAAAPAGRTRVRGTGRRGAVAVEHQRPSRSSSATPVPAGAVPAGPAPSGCVPTARSPSGPDIWTSRRNGW
ncbi:BTAD domain-containing putative transcriptional regulator [Streptomyces sp. ISL-10]|uniref:AfsR/SARP family transcriptional regulator n=1 Tax=Streptomyces sp. ISL-10 TaxID=2819172 RepID=UPI002035ACCF|nr:BTAD domain-containing putative transcriptional regulator [Streptomyces sp. ISL-10]